MTTTSTGGDDVQLVTFKVGGQDFAFNIFQVERILRYEAPAPLPKAPDFLEGVLQYQGSAVPLVDLRKRLGAAAPLREETRTVILEFDGGKIGVIVDAVTEVMQVAAQAVTPPPGIVKGLAAEYIAGLVVQNGRTIVVLNTNKLLNSKEKMALQGATCWQKHRSRRCAANTMPSPGSSKELARRETPSVKPRSARSSRSSRRSTGCSEK